MTSKRNPRKSRSSLIRNAVIVVALLAISAGAYLISQKASVDVDVLMARAAEQFEAGELQASAIDLKTVISEQPDNRAARYLLGQIHIKTGNPKGALKELGRARSLGETADGVGLGITRALLATGKFEEAATEIALSGDDAEPAWLVLRGMLDLAEQRLVDARNTFESSLALHPDHKEARLGLMQVELAAGNAELARREVELLLKGDGEDVGLWIIKGELDLHDGNIEAARDSFARAIELQATNPIARISIARALVLLGEQDEAAKHLDKVGSDGDADPRVNFLRAQIAEGRAEDSVALRALRKVLLAAPTHRESLIMAAKLHFGRSEFTRAQEYLKRLLEIDPENPAVQRMQGAVQLAAGRLDGFTGIAGTPGDPASIEDPGTLALLGTAYLKHGKFADSQATLERAAALAPDSPAIRTQLALSRLSAGDAAGATTELEAIAKEYSDFAQAEIMLTLVHLSQNAPDKALSAVTGLLGRHPENPIAHNAHGYVLEVSDDKPAAQAAFEKALSLDPAFHPARINLARLAISADQPERGREHFNAVLEQDDYHVFALMGLAALALQDDNLDEAERLWLLAREHNPDAVPPRYLLARHYRAKKNDTLAEVLIKEAYKLAPFAPQVQAEYADVMLAAGNFEDALQAARSLTERVPESLQGLELLAKIYNQLGDEAGLTATLQKIADIAPNAVGAQVLLGRLAIRRKDFEQAKGIATELISGVDNAAIGHELLGDSFAAEDRPEDAIETYMQAAELATSSSIVLKLDHLERQLGRAGGRLDKWLEEHPDDVQVRLVRASHMHGEDTGESVITEYERMMIQQKDNPIVLNNLAWLYHEAGDKRAIELAQKAYDLAPRSPEIMDTYGWILFSNGQAEQGLAILKKAEESAPDNPDIGFHMASALHSSGDSHQARKRLDEILRKHAAFSMREKAEALQAKIPAQ